MAHTIAGRQVPPHDTAVTGRRTLDDVTVAEPGPGRVLRTDDQYFRR
jgi:hypothetical protein